MIKFVSSQCNCKPDVEVLFVENTDMPEYIGLAKMRDIEQLKIETKIEVYKEIVELYDTFIISSVRDIVKHKLLLLENDNKKGNSDE